MEGLKLELKENINSQEKEICEKYWELDRIDYSFVNNVKGIAEEYSMTVPGVTGLASIKSSLIFYCEVCGEKIKEYKTRSKINIENIVFDDKIVCKKCKVDRKNNKSLLNREEIITRLDIAVQNSEWKKLDILELELLATISACKTKSEVMKQVFRGLNVNSDEAKPIWDRLNLLDEMELIWIERAEDRSIIDYHSSGKLKEKLEAEYPQFFVPDFVPDFERMQITMQRIPFKTSHNQPDFSGYFNVNEEIVFKPNTQYSYGAWLNHDGTIFLKIEPAKKQIEKGFDELDMPY